MERFAAAAYSLNAAPQRQGRIIATLCFAHHIHFVEQGGAAMTKPMIVDLPHSLGADEAKRRIAGGIGQLRDHLPAGAQVRSAWDGDRMNLGVTAMGQEVAARIDVLETVVRLEVQLPAFLSFFGAKVEKLIKRHGTQLLEDKSSR
jgi:hypothetical protein